MKGAALFLVIVAVLSLSNLVASKNTGSLLKVRRGAEECGGYYFYEMFVTSPNYPSLYANNLDCYYYISTNSSLLNVQLRFITFDTEQWYDFLKVYDGRSTSGRILGSFSGDVIPSILTSTSSSMILAFSTDGGVVKQGFRAEFSFVETGYSSSTSFPGTCGGYFYGNYGVITSPNYPGDYPDDQNCYYHITLDDQFAMIKLTFNDFRTESGLDYLKVYDGSISTESTRKYSGLSTPRNWMSSGYNIVLHFHTDSSIVKRGFSVSYETVYSCDDCETSKTSNSAYVVFGVACGLGFIVIVIGIIVGFKTSRKPISASTPTHARI